jgi:hypothetical protein
MAKRSKKSMHRRKSSHRKSHRKTRGGGWTDKLPMLYPGGLTHAPYTGPGKDCAGVPVRPGIITDYSYVNKGLPGVSVGGGRRRKTHRRRGGASQLGSGGPVIMGGRAGGVLTTGASQELAQMAPAPVMKGGRYGFFPGDGPLNPSNGVGITPAPFYRVACESGTTNPLNPDMALQEATTAVSSAGIKGWTQMAPAMKGGKRGKRRGSRRGRKTKKMRGGVYVGQVDAMRYYAPTAGYDNLPMNPAVRNNPGILMQVGYPARQFNQACMNTH